MEFVNKFMLRDNIYPSTYWAAFGFFLLVILTQFSVRVVDYEQRVVDYQVVLRLGYYFFLLLFFHKYLINFLVYLFTANKGLAIFIGIMLVNALFNGSVYGVYALLTNFIVIFAVYCYLQNYGDSVYRWYVYSVSVFCIASILFYYFIPDVGRYSYWQDGVFSQSSRMQGIAGHPNTLGFMIVSALICLYSFYSWSVFNFSVFLLLVFSLVLTNNRTSILLFILFYYFMYGMKRKMLGYFFLLLLGIIVSILFLFFLVPDFLFSLLGGVSRTGDVNEIFTFTGRSDIWDFAIEMAAKKPLFGWGYGAVSEILVENSDSVGFVVGQTHSLFLQIFLAGGGVSLFIFVLYVVRKLSFFIKNDYLVNFGMLGALLLVGFTEAIIFNTIANAALIVFAMSLFFINKNVQA